MQSRAGGYFWAQPVVSGCSLPAPRGPHKLPFVPSAEGLIDGGAGCSLQPPTLNPAEGQEAVLSAESTPSELCRQGFSWALVGRVDVLHVLSSAARERR